MDGLLSDGCLLICCTNIKSGVNMAGTICIHGHCYQPPRLDPWLEEFLAEPSAAPYLNWNERICRECYSPLAWARRMDQGRVIELINCYEWISFNFGPTLLTWMEHHVPRTYARILEGDARSLERLGHGNALAQVFHHAIMPLTTELDKDVEIAWSIQDFQARFKRRPEGMWLAETAVDTLTLEALARAGIRFTILAPRQARAVATLDGAHLWPVDETTLDTSTPYQVNLPSGKTLVVFFYNGPLSRAVAFERLLADGEAFFQRIASHTGSGLCSLATDGESYGHHFTFGEMALAYAIHRIRTDVHGYELTNYSTWLEQHQPTQSVTIHELSSWSCVHGVERWKSDCGCSDGGHPEWKQQWRQPLRRAFNYLRYYVDEQYFCKGREVFVDPRKALLEYGLVLCGTQDADSFLDEHCSSGAKDRDNRLALTLLTMQRWSLASFASCAWFFDDIGRIEPVNALAFALRSLELLQQSGGQDVSPGLLEILEEAQSNDPAKGDGIQIWKERVLTRRMQPLQIALLTAGLGRTDMSWPGVDVFFANQEKTAYGWTATVQIIWKHTGVKEVLGVQYQDGSEDENMRITAEDGISLQLKDLEERSRGYLCWVTTRKTNAALWHNGLAAAGQWSCVMNSFGEGQKAPLGNPGEALPGLVWFWIVGDTSLDPEYLSWLRHFLGENMFFSTMLCTSLREYVLDLLNRETVSVDEIIPMISRARDVGIKPYWWDVQNRVWELRKVPGMDSLAGWVGMKI